MNNIAPPLSLPSVVTIGASVDLLGHHNDNLKDHFDSDNENNTVTTFFAPDGDYSDDDTESCESEFSEESTYDSSTSYMIHLSGNSKPHHQQGLPVCGDDDDETSVAKKLNAYRTKPRLSVQRRMSDNEGISNCESDEDSVVLLRRDREFQDPNHFSWSDKILETMKDVDSIIVPLKGAEDVEGKVDDYYPRDTS